MTTIQTKPQILSVALDIPLYQTFSYIHDKPLAYGQRVLVEFHHKKVIGFVWNDDKPTKSINATLKPILEVYPEVIPADVIALIKFCADYYHYPLGGVIFSAIPKILKQAKVVNYVIPAEAGIWIPGSSPRMTNNTSLRMTNEQQIIFDDIATHLNHFYPSIIYGITGSGKTELYLQLIAEVLKLSKQVLVLVPEINLTPQMLERFKTKFNDKSIAVLTSHATARARYLGYSAALDGSADIIIGTRLSVFTPF